MEPILLRPIPWNFSK